MATPAPLASMFSRSEIISALYLEVQQASKQLEAAPPAPHEEHLAAREQLRVAVERYNNFALDGVVPDGLHIVEP
jgi:hypothetical protein